jgi:hypothetical protein
MKKLFYGFAISALVTVQIASAAETPPSWLCIAEQSTGFAFINGAWRTTNFTPEKYILKIRKVDDIERCLDPSIELGKCPDFKGYVFTKFGEDDGEICRNNNSTAIICGSIFSHVIFYKATLRFMNIYKAGYVDGDRPGNTPSITIGKCASL